MTMLLRLPGNKTAIVTRRVDLFHETFAPLRRSSKDHHVVGILWYEAIYGRNSEDLASAYTKDTALVSEVNSIAGLDKVTLKYMCACYEHLIYRIC